MHSKNKKANIRSCPIDETSDAMAISLQVITYAIAAPKALYWLLLTTASSLNIWFTLI